MMPTSPMSLALAPMTPPSGVNPVPPIAPHPGMQVPGKPADANPSQVPLSLSPANSQAAPPPAPSPVPLAAGNATPYASVTPNAPGAATDYTNKTIAPGAGVDRLALAQSNWDNFAKSTEPDYKAAIRDTDTAAAGAGQIGSGMLRTRHGDLALARSHDLDSAKTSFLNDATSGSIDDNYRNIGIAQQQQGFQNDQQQQAFGQQMSIEQLMEMLRSGAFGRSATRLALGNSGNPSDTALQLSGIYGKQAGDAGSSAGDLLKNSILSRTLRTNPNVPTPATPYDVNDPNQNIYAGIK